MPRRMAYDRWLFFDAGFLVLGGLLMVGSASTFEAMQYGRHPSSFLIRHALHALLGLAVSIPLLMMPYQRLGARRLLSISLICCALGLILVLMMPAVGGAHRWIPIGPLNLQPSEFAKVITVLFMAYVLSRKEDRVNDLWAVPLPCLMVVGGFAYLVVIEPDLGSAVMLFLVACTMIVVAGLRWQYVGVLSAGGLAAVLVAIVSEPFRIERVLTYVGRSPDPLGAGFQLNQSLIAIGAGGLTGAGFGQGQQKAFYIPAAHTDFIFSVIGEELGLLGTGVLLLAFSVLFWRGVRAALRAPDRFGFYLALGMTTLLVLQGFVNMAVCLGLMPTKGLPLPFISYGGSSLLASMVALGVLLNVSQHSN